jgi:cytochrome c556
MRFRTLALALALSCGVGGVVQASPKKPVARSAQRKTTKKFRQAKASKVKPRKAKKFKRANK